MAGRAVALGLMAMGFGCVWSWAQTAPATQAWADRLKARQVEVSAGLWEVERGVRLDGVQPERALIPASTTKVASTYALLKRLNPEAVVATEVWGDLRDGVVRGPLILKGGGDPRLTSERLWMLVQELKRKGIRRVEGEIVFDQSAFDAQRYGDGWGNTTTDATPPILPLSVNFNRREDGAIDHDPEPRARALVKRLLEEAGISVGGSAVKGGPPQPLLTFPSLPLRDAVRDINKWSNNFMVEMLVKHLGEGRWNVGVARILEVLHRDLKLPKEQAFLTDGSGLSKDNRLSAQALATILRAAWHDFEVGPEFVDSLKVIGGEPFPLKVKDPDLARRVRCKTGYLSGVHAVCGYLKTTGGSVRVFAILLNGARAEEKDLWAQVKRWVGEDRPSGGPRAPGR